MTFRQAFLDGVRRFSTGPVPSETPELDARVLLGHAAGLSLAALLARWPEPMDAQVQARWSDALIRREAGEPVAWITGVKEFLGLDFEVGPGLLVPRADTETLVEAALEVGVGPRVADLCTGTGCVAVGLAALSPRPLEIWAADLSPLAVETARRNARRLLPTDRRVDVVLSDLMAGLDGRWDAVVSNPPYLTPAETRERLDAGWREPALALDGGGDGLDLIRRLAAEASGSLKPGGWLLVEAADAQMDAIAEHWRALGYDQVRFWNDLSGQRRVIGARSNQRWMR